METKIKEISRLQIVLTELNLVEIRRSEAENKVPSEFIKIAEAILNGHFLVTNGYGKDVKVYPTCVELYWHEEQGDIKDYIVYHRNSKKTKPVIFTHGVLHNHVSGIDITFELGNNPESAIRASALIREYKVVKNGNPVKDKWPEKRSTYLYEDLYGQFSAFDGGFCVKWEDDENVCNTIRDTDCTHRYNVSNYIEKNGEIIKEPYIANETIGRKTANGKYVQDERRWRFTVNDHDTRF